MTEDEILRRRRLLRQRAHMARIRQIFFGNATPGPTNTAAPVITTDGSPAVGETISVSNGTWSGTGTIAYDYQWLRNGSPISGANSNSYTLVTADGGTSITATVTATDDNGATSATSAPVSIAVVAPSVIVAPVINTDGTPEVGETFTVTPGTYGGTGPYTPNYQWRRNGLVIPGAAGTSYTAVSADGGQVLRVYETVSNGAGAAVGLSNEITVASEDAILAAAPTAWWSADTGVTEVAGAVSLWSDKTGNKPDLAQTTAANRPILNATTLGGQPGLVFDGVNDSMSCLPDFQYGTNPVSVAFVARIDSYANSNATVYRNYSSAGRGIIGRFDANPGKFYMYLGATGTTARIMVHDYSISTPSGVLIFIIRYGRASGQQSSYISDQGSSLISDNIADTAGNDATPGSGEPFVVGARSNNTNVVGMALGDLAVWENRLLTDAEVNAIGAQLATKYGVTFTGP